PGQTQPWPGRTDEMTPVPDHGETSWTGRGRLTGKRALITGGDSGIGRATAIAFAKEGADAASAFLPEEGLVAEKVRAGVEAAGRRCLLLPIDQRTEAADAELVARTVEGLGVLDTLVSNAAFQMGTNVGIEEFDTEQ